MTRAITGEDFTEAEFCADHLDVLTGERHGHTWFVRIWWPSEPHRDARAMHAGLVESLKVWDCKQLETCGLTDTTNFGVAKALAHLIPNLTRVYVRRGGFVPCGSEVRL